MTSEQKQRIEQIRERHEHNKSAVNDHGQPIPKYLATAYSDIDFLLSLVKSQEATSASELICNWRDEWKIPVPDIGTALDSQSDLIARVAAFANNAATSMRSDCIEKVKAWASAHKHAFVGHVIDELYKELENSDVQRAS